jgi:hypothetical protein
MWRHRTGLESIFDCLFPHEAEIWLVEVVRIWGKSVWSIVPVVNVIRAKSRRIVALCLATSANFTASFSVLSPMIFIGFVEVCLYRLFREKYHELVARNCGAEAV